MQNSYCILKEFLATLTINSLSAGKQHSRPKPKLKTWWQKTHSCNFKTQRENCAHCQPVNWKSLWTIERVRQVSGKNAPIWPIRNKRRWWNHEEPLKLQSKLPKNISSLSDVACPIWIIPIIISVYTRLLTAFKAYYPYYFLWSTKCNVANFWPCDTSSYVNF